MADKARQETDIEETEAADAGYDPGMPAAEGAQGEPVEQAGGLEAEIAKLNEALLRTHAELENVRKRAEREVERSRLFALERFAKDLVPVLDSLDQALANGADPGSSEVAPEGLQLVHRQLVSALERHGLEVLDPVGQPFDPSWHEAMTLQPSGETEPNTVLQVLQKGIKLHDRLLRPARVIVSRPPD